MIRAPFAYDRIESECHDAGGVGVSVGREFLDGYLGLCELEFPAVWHKDCGPSDGGVEHLYQTLLAHHVRILEVVVELILEGLACNFAAERVNVLDGSDAGLGVMPGSCAVNEAALEVNDESAAIVHSHSPGIRNVSDVGHFHILAAAVFLESFGVLRGYDYRHSFL